MGVGLGKNILVEESFKKLVILPKCNGRRVARADHPSTTQVGADDGDHDIQRVLAASLFQVFIWSGYWQLGQAGLGKWADDRKP